MNSLEVSEGKKNDPISMHGTYQIIGMNLNSSQTKMVQSSGLGNFGQHSVPIWEPFKI
jgi:hypothetical protein